MLCGSDDLATQKLVNYANDLLGAYGGTLDLEAVRRIGCAGAIVAIDSDFLGAGVSPV